VAVAIYAADAGELRQMKLGDIMIWRGRAYVLRGTEPMSVPDPRAVLEDRETGEVVTAPLREVHEGPHVGDNQV
jgi:hypothetical protein